MLLIWNALINSVEFFLLFLLLQQSEVLVQFGLNLLHPFICVFGRGVQLLLQQTQTDVGLAQLLALGRSHIHYTYSISDSCPVKITNSSDVKLDGSCWGHLLECVTLILSDFLSSLMTVSLSSSFTPRPSASVISALMVDALISTGGV